MKRINLIALLLLTAFIAMGQSTYKRGLQIGVNGAVMDTVKEVDSRLVPYVEGVPVPVWNDSILILLNRIKVLEGGDVIAPGVDSAYIQTGNDSVIIVLFNEALGQADNDSVVYGFSFTYGSNDGTLDSAIVSELKVYLYSSINIPGDDTVYVSYTKPVSKGVHDPSYNYTASFSNKLAFNGTSLAAYDPFAWWRFNGDLLDDGTLYDGTAVNTITYTGDTALIFSEADGDDAVNIGDTIPDQHTFWCWLLLDEGADFNYYIFANKNLNAEDGFSFYANGDAGGTFGFTYIAGNGVDDTYAYENTGTFKDDTWHHLVVSVDREGDGTDAYVKIYVDGVQTNAGTDFTLTNFSDDFAVSGQDIIIGARAPGAESDGLRNGAIMGEFGVAGEVWTQAQIDSSFAQGGEGLWSVGSTPVPETYETVYTIYETIDFTGEDLDEWSMADIDAAFIGDAISYDGTNGYITTLGSDTVWRVDAPASTTHSFMGQRIKMELPTTYSEVWLSYNFWLPSTWDTEGMSGKFPGLMVSNQGVTTECQTGYAVAASCTDIDLIPGRYLITDGSSPRGGFEENDFGIYMYSHNLRRRLVGCNVVYGDNFYPGETWAKQTWHNMTYRMVINDLYSEGVGRTNGIIEMYKDGVCVEVVTGIIFREYSDLYFDQYFLGLFFGGPIYPERPTTAVYFDDIILWDFQDGHGYAKGNTANALGTVIDPPQMK